jgi:hypothetical protein
LEEEKEEVKRKITPTFSHSYVPYKLNINTILVCGMRTCEFHKRGTTRVEQREEAEPPNIREFVPQTLGRRC